MTKTRYRIVWSNGAKSPAIYSSAIEATLDALEQIRFSFRGAVCPLLFDIEPERGS